MTYYDASGGEREDRIIVGYDFTDNSVASINLACNGQTPRVVIDLGNAPGPRRSRWVGCGLIGSA